MEYFTPRQRPAPSLHFQLGNLFVWDARHLRSSLTNSASTWPTDNSLSKRQCTFTLFWSISRSERPKYKSILYNTYLYSFFHMKLILSLAICNSRKTAYPWSSHKLTTTNRIHRPYSTEVQYTEFHAFFLHTSQLLNVVYNQELTVNRAWNR